jgi:nitrogen fixation protein FixH
MIEAHTKSPRPREFTGWHMLALMLTFFAVIFGVNFYMAFSATRTWTGLVVENSYVASQQFNTKLANARTQQEMGWQGGLDYIDSQLQFSLRDGEGRALRPTSVVIELSRPIGVTGDQSVVLSRAADGSFTAPVDLAPGVWNAAIVAQFSDQPDYEHRARLVIGSKS